MVCPHERVALLKHPRYSSGPRSSPQEDPAPEDPTSTPPPLAWRLEQNEALHSALAENKDWLYGVTKLQLSVLEGFASSPTSTVKC